LAARYDVARATVDRAVSSLVKKGILKSKRGSGTVVASSAPVRNIGFIEKGWELQSRSDISAGIRIERIRFGDLQSKSERNHLRKLDGLIWSYPENQQLGWARETPPSQPQLIINRHIDEFNYVSIDHRGAIRDITAKRLADCPDGIPVFLTDAHADGLVWGMREQGFVDACRAANRFYEVVPLPGSFEGRIAALEAKLPGTLKRPFILVSGSRINTGAVVAWVKGRGLTWKKDVYYSDFDNEYPLDIWGLTVTSFVQDTTLLTEESIRRIIDLITGVCTQVKELILPTFLEGDT
jgi:DNA-binding LacI/PurR family transcriptional regulator